MFYSGNLVLGAHLVLTEEGDCYNMAPLSIGDYIIPSNHLAVRPITIDSKVWGAAEAMIAPVCRVADGCLARAMVHRALEPWAIYYG